MTAAQDVADEFEKVMRVIQEFQTASINKQGSAQNVSMWAEHLKEQTESELTLRNQTLQEVNEKYKKLENQLQERTKEYQKAFEATTPSGMYVS